VTWIEPTDPYTRHWAGWRRGDRYVFVQGIY
jgi:hypothetical protein